MAKQTTRDAALSRLFGNRTEPQAEPQAPVENPEGPTDAVARPERKSPGRPASTPARADRRKSGGGEEAATPVDQPAAESGASGYIGLGRYSRSDGVVERITPYVRPDQAEALRIAVARKSDPRGRDISQIIQSLLDEAGYSS